MNILILKFDDLNDEKLFYMGQTYNLREKGIYKIFKSRRISDDIGEIRIQIISYDPPLVNLDNSNDNNSIVRDFICKSIFDENGNEFNFTD